ncbi:ABC transporter permease, partial [Methylobacterium radiotolerans]
MQEAELRGRWWRFLLILIITAVVLVPIAAIFLLSLQPSLGSTTTSEFTFENFTNIFSQTGVLTWLNNSLLVTFVTVMVSVVVGSARPGYVLFVGGATSW